MAVSVQCFWLISSRSEDLRHEEENPSFAHPSYRLSASRALVEFLANPAFIASQKGRQNAACRALRSATDPRHQGNKSTIFEEI